MNEQKIISMYRDQSKSTYEIAEHFKTYPNKIRRILIKHGVEIKDKSAAQKNAIKNGKATIPTQGKARSKEEKLKISKSLQKRWQNMTEEEYKKHVDRAKKRWSNMSKAEKLRMSELAIKAIQKAGKDGSKLEKFLREEISRHGYTVQAHKKNLIPNENLEIDMYFPELKAIIEVDGPSHFLPIWGEEKLRKQIKADSHKTGLILSKGFAIIRVKSLHDSVSLHSKEELKNKLIDILDNFSKHFPSKSKRYLEIEV